MKKEKESKAKEREKKTSLHPPFFISFTCSGGFRKMAAGKISNWSSN